MRNDLERTRWDTPANKEPSDEALDRHGRYAIAQAWAEETVRELQNSRRFAWIVALMLIIACGAQAAVIAIMLPLKQIVPYTILVDKTTGYLEMVRGVKLGDLPQDQAVVQSLLAQYVMARETVDAADLTERYKRVALWSDGAARADYIAAFRPGASAMTDPTNKISVTVKTVEIVSKSLATVRFATVQHAANGAETTADWQATLGFRFSGAPMRMEDRLINPLGFQAVSYRRDAETLPAAPVEAALQTNTPLAPPPAAAPEPVRVPGDVKIAPPQPAEP